MVLSGLIVIDVYVCACVCVCVCVCVCWHNTVQAALTMVLSEYENLAGAYTRVKNENNILERQLNETKDYVQRVQQGLL